jgi:Kef-type K+ transport system membrane component KefB
MYNLDYFTPTSRFITQLILILIAAQVVGKLLRYLKQPQVVGEVLAGILLGPSLFGLIAPEAFEFIFEKNSISTLSIVSQLGLILFMFTVGLHSSAAGEKTSRGKAAIISAVSIIFPFTLGFSAAPLLFNSFAQTGTSSTIFSLFLGIACSITAFPVLARIISDKGLSKDPTSQMALHCAAIDDVSAWIILAAIIGLTKSSALSALVTTLGLSLAGVFFLLKIVSPLLSLCIKSERFSESRQFTLALVTLLCSSLYFELIGVHALFGAFIAGSVMPDNAKFHSSLRLRIEYVAGLVLLPVFFSVTGLRTQITLIDSWELWLISLGIIALCVIGKLAGATIAARFCAFSWRDSFFIGVLMNTRGLMELVVLNIGLELKIISSSLFTIMVLMALATTLMTGPLIDIIKRK